MDGFFFFAELRLNVGVGAPRGGNERLLDELPRQVNRDWAPFELHLRIVTFSMKQVEHGNFLDRKRFCYNVCEFFSSHHQAPSSHAHIEAGAT